MRTSLRCGAVLFSCALLFVPNDAYSQEVSLLIGVADRVDYTDLYGQGPQHLRTYWIRSTDGRVQEPVMFGGLIVPRGSGFVRVAITRVCKGLRTDHDECIDAVTIRPATLPRRSEGSYPAADPDDSDGRPCMFATVAVTFASPSYLSIFRHDGNSDRCEPRSLHYMESVSVRNYGSDKSIPFSTFGPSAATAYRRAAMRALNVDPMADEPRKQDEYCQADPESQTAWSIARRNGRWIPELFQQQGPADCQLRGSIAWHLGSRILGYADPLGKGSVTDKEGFGSPDGAWTLSVTPPNMELRMGNGDPPEVQLLLPAEHIVMVQWASRESMAEWARALARVSR